MRLSPIVAAHCSPNTQAPLKRVALCVGTSVAGSTSSSLRVLAARAKIDIAGGSAEDKKKITGAISAAPVHATDLEAALRKNSREPLHVETVGPESEPESAAEEYDEEEKGEEESSFSTESESCFDSPDGATSSAWEDGRSSLAAREDAKGKAGSATRDDENKERGGVGGEEKKDASAAARAEGGREKRGQQGTNGSGGGRKNDRDEEQKQPAVPKKAASRWGRAIKHANTAGMVKAAAPGAHGRALHLEKGHWGEVGCYLTECFGAHVAPSCLLGTRGY